MNHPAISIDTMGINAVYRELESARRQHAPLNSAHEAFAVIAEELDEFWDEVRAKSEVRSKDRMRKELVQVAAMCIRAITDLGLFGDAFKPSVKGQLEAAHRATQRSAGGGR